ncbi:hypothetical protein MY10362_009641 [Beauveria mimosiformis]
MPSLVSWLVAGLAVAQRAASLSYTLSKTYDASNFLDEFEFHTSPIDLGPGFSAPYMNYQNKADALDKGLVSVQNGKIYLGVDSKNELSPWSNRATVRVQSKNSFKQGLVITRFSHLPEPVCGGNPFFGTRGTGQYPDVGVNMYEGWDLYPVKKVGVYSPGTGQCDEYQLGQASQSGDCKINILPARDSLLHQFCHFEEIQNKIWGSPEGGIQALEWTSDAIKLYNWPIDAAPSNIESSNPDTSSWGTPYAQFTNPGCDTQKIFSNQTLEFSPGFCGGKLLWSSDYADGKYGPTCHVITGEERCESHVAKNPEVFKNFYFEVENIRIFDQNIQNTQGQLSLDGSGPSFTFDYTTSQPSSDNWIGVWPDSDAEAPQSGSVAWDYVAQSSGSIRIPPPSSMKAGKYKAYLLSNDRTVLASLPSFDYNPTSNTQDQLSLDGSGPSLTFDYATSQPSSDNWIGVWPDSDAQAPQSGSVAWEYVTQSSGSIHIPPPSSMKAGKYKAYLLSNDRTVLASLPSFDYSPTSDTMAFSVKTHYKTNCAGSVDNNVDIEPGSGVCVNTDCAVGSLEIPSVGSCPNGQVRISYWQNADCTGGDWYGYDYGSRGTCRGLWSNGWGFKSLWLSCADPDSDCVKLGTCTAAPEPSTEVCRAAADAGTTDAFHLKTRYSTSCTGDVHNEVTVAHGNGQCIDTDCAVGSLDIDNVGNCPDGELRISYWEQSGCSGKWFGYGYGSRNTCRPLWSAGSSFKSLWVSCAKQSDDCVSRGTCSIDQVPSRPVCS